MGRGRSKGGGAGSTVAGGGTATVTMAGGSGGGGGVLPQVTNYVTPPTPQQIANGNVLPSGGVAFNQFMQMTDDQKADVVASALSTGVPIFLDDSGLQRFAYFTGMSDKPTIVSDSALDGMSGKDLYRTVKPAYNSTTDIGYTSTDICKQIAKGDFTMYSDSGGSAYGKAIYFADSFSDSSWYGNGNSKDLMMRAKITSGKTISTTSLRSKYSAALNSGDKLATACSRADRQSASNLYALAKGYSAVIDSGGYHMILNRGCLSMSDSTVKNPRSAGYWSSSTATKTL